MLNEHDFIKFPELTNNQLELFYFDSPHKQITEDINVKVTRVIDGDTVQVKWFDRDFEFPIRIANIAAPELNETGGKESKSWLESQVKGKDVFILLTEQRVEKWGRLLADIISNGMSISELSIINNKALPWSERKKGTFLEQLEAIK